MFPAIRAEQSNVTDALHEPNDSLGAHDNCRYRLNSERRARAVGRAKPSQIGRGSVKRCHPIAGSLLYSSTSRRTLYELIYNRAIMND
jgi:hypothetical protein